MDEKSTLALENFSAETFSPYDPSMPYVQIFPRVQAAIAHSLTKEVDSLGEDELKRYIRRYIVANRVRCDAAQDVDSLCSFIYHDMAGLSFISRENLLEMSGFEELDINSWDDIEIIVNGERKKTAYRFHSPGQALDIILRIFRQTSTNFDVATPRATADIGSGVRITALRVPLVDEDVGVAASIRKVNTQTVSRERLVGSGLTDEMMSFLELCILHGVSICVSGETGAGKTTLAGALLQCAVDRSLRVYTIEEGSREWNFVARDAKGAVTTSVIHTKTRPTERDANHMAQDVTQEELVKDSLRFNPTIISPGEIRGREAFEVMGVSNTGHTVITTVHSNGTLDTPERIVTLAKKAYDMSDHTLYSMCARAFPLLVHMAQGADRRRRVTEIREVCGYSEKGLNTRLLWEFSVTDNIYEGDVCTFVRGEWVKTNPMSDALKSALLKKGAKRSEIERFAAKPEA